MDPSENNQVQRIESQPGHCRFNPNLWWFRWLQRGAVGGVVAPSLLSVKPDYFEYLFHLYQSLSVVWRKALSLVKNWKFLKGRHPISSSVSKYENIHIFVVVYVVISWFYLFTVCLLLLPCLFILEKIISNFFSLKRPLSDLECSTDDPDCEQPLVSPSRL